MSPEPSINATSVAAESHSKDFHDILKQWLSVAESQACALDVLSEQVPDLNVLLTENMERLSESFTVIASASNRLEAPLATIAESNGDIPSALEDIAHLQKELTTAISNAIVGMQFQDRVSQNLVIMEKVIRAIDEHQRTTVDQTLEMVGGKRKAYLNYDFARKITELFTLGELKQKFLTLLVNDGYISHQSDLGIEVTETEKTQEDDVELF